MLVHLYGKWRLIQCNEMGRRKIMGNIKHIYKMLNWKNPSKIQLEGIRLAKQIDDLSLLICPPAEPSVWEHCADILCDKSDDVLEPYINSLLEWLQDLNWPGALAILNRLKAFSGKKLKMPFLKCVERADELYKKDGTMWIVYLSELLDNEDLKAELPKEILNKLQNI